MSSKSFVETDPSCRYRRYAEILSSSESVEEFRAFDRGKSMNVSWSKVKLGSFSSDEAKIKRLQMKISLLKNVKSNNIIPVYKVWRNKSENTLNIISEICTWNLLEYQKQYGHGQIPLRTIKKWCKQILKGLHDLHTHEPCIIHRNLNYTNVFINDTNGLVKIGGFALAEIQRRNYLIYDNPKFSGHFQDIYMYGLCVADLVAPGVPHYQCGDPITISFIDKCMTQLTAPSAAQLLLDPFFDQIFDDDEEEDDNIANSLTLPLRFNWRMMRPDLLESVYEQLKDLCWAVSFTRQLACLSKIHGYLRNGRTLTIKKLIDGVHRRFQTEYRAIDFLENAKEFLVSEGYINDMVVYHKPREDIEEDNKIFEDMIKKLLLEGPVSVTIRLYQSYVKAAGKVGIFSPTEAELEESVYLKPSYHTLLLFAYDMADGIEYWEMQESQGDEWGYGGLVRFARHKRLIEEVVHLKV